MTYYPQVSLDERYGVFHVHARDPNSTDDISAGFSVGTRWINATSGVQFTCIDDTISSASWTIIGNTASYIDSVSPTTAEDAGAGYHVGDRWLNLTNATEYVCYSTSNDAAVWEKSGNTITFLKSDDPTVTDDDTQFYGLGDRWINLSGAREWLCIGNDTGAASWIPSASLITQTTVDPTADDDLTDGYYVGARWLNLQNGTEFVCYNSSEGLAVWIQDGTVVGPTSATHNAIPKFDTTTGRLIKNSTITIDDSGNLNLGSAKIQSLADGVASSDAVTKGQLDQAIQGLDWQDSVISRTESTPPVSPTSGDRYVVGSGATGSWSGHVNSVAEYNGSSWSFTAPSEGFAVWVEDTNALYVYNGSSWVTFGSTSSHSSLSSLTSGDDHTQYVKITGRSGGQTIYGGTSAGDDLVLLSTSDLTPGNVSISNALFSDLTASTVPYLNASKVLTSSSVTPTELGYVSGVTSAIQTQLDGKVATTVTVNGHALSSNVTVSASDVGLGSVENTALSTWAGSTNITTVGTIATGAWSGTTIAVNKGGTGETSYTDGQLLIGNSTGNTLTKASLTAGSAALTITPGNGSITIDVAQGSISHNSLSNLTTGDVHTHYALLAGRSGGQSLVGGTGSGENLTLTSTSHGTKGAITVASSVNFQSFVPYFTEYDNGDSGSSITINWNNGIKQKMTVTGTPAVLTFTAPPGPCNLTFTLTQGSGGSKTITWPAAVKWSGGAAPTLSTSASAVDIVSMYYNGTNYYADYSLNFS